MFLKMIRGNITFFRFLTICLVVNLTVTTTTLKAQDNNKSEVRGSVLDSATNAPFPDFTVYIKGKNNTGRTDGAGNFILSNIGKNDTIFFSQVGYITQEIAFYPGLNLLNIKLAAKKNMDEVVVTALGIKRSEKALGYAVQKVGGDALQTVKGVDMATSLTGQVSGLVIKNSTEFNATPNIELRGETPLLVIDGVPYGNMNLRDVPTDNIENIDILKGPTASALYGSRGQSGAIMVTTKRGKGKGLTMDFNSNNMFTLGYIAIPKVQTSYAHGIDGKISDDYVWGPKLDIGDSAMQWNPISKKNEMLPLVSSGKRNLQNFMNTGVISNNNFAITSTGENGFFRAGLNYIYNKGQFPNATLKIINYTMSGQLKVGKNFDLLASMGYTRETSPQNW